eukprot:Partr_v1_DN27182_c2_g2_i1_m15745
MNRIPLIARRLPGQVSRQPMEALGLLLLIALFCYHRLIQSSFGPSSGSSSHAGALNIRSWTSPNRHLFDGQRLWMLEESAIDASRPPFLLVKSFLVQGGGKSQRVHPRGALNRHTFKALTMLRDHLESFVFEWVAGVNVTFDSICPDLGSSCHVYSPEDLLGSASSSPFASDDKLVDALSRSIVDKSRVDGSLVAVDSLFDNLQFDNHGLVGGAASLVLSYVFNVTSDAQFQSIQRWSKQAAYSESEAFTPESLVKLRHVKELRQRSARNRSNFAWMATFVHGFWTVKDLVENAETIDVMVVVLGYIGMHFTVIVLFLNMRKLGSRFSLFFSTIVGGALALACSLVVVTAFGHSINIIQLSEGIPFLVIVVGFDKTYILAKAVLNAEEVDFDPSKSQGKSSLIPIGVRRKILLGIDQAGPHLLRQYAVEIAVLTIGTLTGIPSLSEFCMVTGVALLFDCLCSFTLFVAVLTLKMELQRLRDAEMPESQNARKPFNKVDAISELYTPMKSGTTHAKLILLFSIAAAYTINRSGLYSSPAMEISFGQSGPVEIPNYVNCTLAQIAGSASGPTIIDYDVPLFFYANGIDTDHFSERLQGILNTILAGFGYNRLSDAHVQALVVVLFLSFIVNVYLLRKGRISLDPEVPQSASRSAMLAKRSSLPVSLESSFTKPVDTTKPESQLRISESDEDVYKQCLNGKLPLYALEKTLGPMQVHSISVVVSSVL